MLRLSGPENVNTPVFSSTLVLESILDLGLPGIGGLNGITVGTAIDPAVMVRIDIYHFIFFLRNQIMYIHI